MVVSVSQTSRTHQPASENDQKLRLAIVKAAGLTDAYFHNTQIMSVTEGSVVVEFRIAVGTDEGPGVKANLTDSISSGGMAQALTDNGISTAIVTKTIGVTVVRPTDPIPSSVPTPTPTSDIYDSTTTTPLPTPTRRHMPHSFTPTPTEEPSTSASVSPSVSVSVAASVSASPSVSPSPSPVSQMPITSTSLVAMVSLGSLALVFCLTMI